jgi:hypothetical protein
MTRGTRFLATAALGLLATATMLAAAVRETGWCRIETPDEASPGGTVEVRVTLKPGAVTAEADKLSCHLHWMKKDGFGGMLSWVPHQTARDGGVHTFRHTPALNAQMHTIATLVYLSPDGDFGKMTKRADGAPIRVATDPADAAAEAARIRRPETATLKRSFIRIVPVTRRVTKGDEFVVTAEYVLDPADNWGDGTMLELVPLGPWVDNPDGKYTTRRSHHGYPGLGSRRVPVEPGRGTRDFSFRLGGTFRYNEIQWLARFIGGDGQAWPWSVRGDGPRIERHIEDFDLLVPAEGGLFTWEEQPRADLVWGDKPPAGPAVEVSFRLVDTEGKTVASFGQTVAVGARGTRTPVELPEIGERGVLLLLATIGGVTRDAFFARVPDVRALLGERATPFGVTNVGDPLLSRVARRLGATHCRHFTSWQRLEPLPGQWRCEELDERLEANRAAGLVPWICLVDPPPWVLPAGMFGAGFEPFPCDGAAWERTAGTLAARYRGRIRGFEWLNEIVPGNKCADPIREYIDFCRIGTRAVRRTDATMKIQLAGGLWPRNFRLDLLNGGIADHIDVLPVHYSGEAGVREALRDVAAAGRAGAIAVWDNESARGLSVWGMPPEENIVRSTVQSRWVLRQWPAELVAGAEAVVYFGGHVAAAGNWSYLLDPATPRPVAATLAVLAAKTGRAKPLATAYVAPGAVLHIFERDGAGLAVACTVADADDASAALRLPAGAPVIIRTDHQGNERQLATDDGVLTAELGAMPVFLEGFDLATLAVQAGLEVGTLGPAPKPVLTVVEGPAAAAIPLRVKNPLGRPVTGNVSVSLAAGVVLPPRPVSLAPGAEEILRLPLAAAALPAAGESRSMDGTAELTWTSPAAVSARKPFTLLVIDPAALGNLLTNGDMEMVDGSKPAAWSGDAESVELAGLGSGPGFAGRAARFDGTKSRDYQHAGQTVRLPAPGREYLYTAWVWNEDMQAGSNLAVDDKTYYIPSVFDAGRATRFWRLLTHVRSTPASATSMTLIPVVRGSGWAMYDNIRLTIHEGTDHAAEARRARRPIAVDGNLGDWDFADPIPLLCDNQLAAPQGYVWSPANLSGVAKFSWDEKSLFFAAQVRDDRHVANTTGEATTEGDCIVIALHPGNRVDGTDAQAFAWHVGAAAPGGGSGRHTLYRPPARSGGLSSGQLARDSSVYELAVRREGDITAYELRIPWAETGGLSPATGVKAGLSLQLVDADGTGAPALMTWGGGLRPAWCPAAFGVLTLID